MSQRARDMAASRAKPEKKRTKWDNRVVRKPAKGSKTEAILTLATTTPATPPQIARTVNTSRQLVHQALERYGIDANTLESFKESRADILAAAQLKDMQAYLSIDDDERKSRIKTRGLVDFGIAYDKERLERGESTENVSVITKVIRELRDRDE